MHYIYAHHDIWWAWYNGSYSTTAKPMKILELHHPMIQFLIIAVILLEHWADASLVILFSGLEVKSKLWLYSINKGPGAQLTGILMFQKISIFFPQTVFGFYPTPLPLWWLWIFVFWFLTHPPPLGVGGRYFVYFGAWSPQPPLSLGWVWTFSGTTHSTEWKERKQEFC